MENYYGRMVENLGKLKRNEEQMTPEQREKYKKPLQKLKQAIKDDATEMMLHFLIGGCRILKSDEKGMADFIEAAQRILDEDDGKTSKEAGRVLFATYDEEKFLEALIPLHYRIWYEAYGPVWLSHCIPTADPEYPYTNDIIKMEWEAKSSVWINREELSFTTMLPPTKELLEKRYQEDRTMVNGG